MNKKVGIIILCAIVLIGVIVGIVFLTSGNSNNENTTNNTTTNGTNEQNVTQSLKENEAEAKYQIEVAMQKLLEEAYGSEVVDARIYVQKIYTAEDEQNDEMLKSLNLGKDEVAFSVEYELKPADGVDVIKFTAATGEYDEESGWVKEKYNVGILRPDGDSYKITDFGTSF